MTDITDQDRRDARQWASRIGKGTSVAFDDAKAAARYILATVDAPAPTTLAERLQYRADLLDNGDPDGDTPQALRDLATHAAQMEQDLTEARAEVERLTADLKVALDKVDRLTAERNRIATGRYVTYAEVDGKAVQKGAESNAETPNPAYVKPGEAWIVECRGERRTAVKDMDDDVPWNTVAADGLFFSEENENVTLLHRLVPAPRVITNPDELEQLAATSIIRDGRGWPGGVTDQGVIMINGFCLSDEEVLSRGPVTVLWEPVA